MLEVIIVVLVVGGVLTGWLSLPFLHISTAAEAATARINMANVLLQFARNNNGGTWKIHVNNHASLFGRTTGGLHNLPRNFKTVLEERPKFTNLPATNPQTHRMMSNADHIIYAIVNTHPSAKGGNIYVGQTKSLPYTVCKDISVHWHRILR